MKIISIVFFLILSLSTLVVAQPVSNLKVKKVTYIGNESFDDTRLAGLMLTRSSKFLATSKFYPDIFDDDLSTLISFYKQNGFLQAQIIDTTVSIDSLNNEVDITIKLQEGVRTFVESVSIFGNEFFEDSTLQKYIAIKAGDALRRPKIEDAVISLLSLYAEHGFLDATVTPQVQINDSMHLALIDFACQEGISSTVGKIQISGAEKTNQYVLTRELNFHEGDTIKYSQLLNSQRQLYFTGLFSSVFVRPLPFDSTNSTARNIIIEVKEKPSSELSFSLGYGTVERVRGRIEYNSSNLGGTARKAGAGIEANFIKQGITLSFSEPWTFGTRWKTDIALTGQLLQEPSYHAETIGSKLTFGHKIGTHTTFSTSFRFENTNLSRVDLNAPLDELDPRIRSLAVIFSHDTRNNLFDPSKGLYINWSNELAGSFLQGSNTFVKSVFKIKKFMPTGRNSVVGTSLEIGWMDSYGESIEIPVNERFYTGGPTSLRAFGYQLVGPLDSNNEPLGGQFKLVWNIFELRKSIYKMFGMAFFVDAGNVWNNVDEFKISGVRIDFGSGIRINSPLGILRIDGSYNPDKQANESSFKFLFSIGQAF